VPIKTISAAQFATAFDLRPNLVAWFLGAGDERRTFAEYQEHVRGLAERHVCGVAGRAIRFPAAMEGIFS